jgi:hypothetical protein
VSWIPLKYFGAICARVQFWSDFIQPTMSPAAAAKDNPAGFCSPTWRPRVGSAWEQPHSRQTAGWEREASSEARAGVRASLLLHDGTQRMG